MPAGVAETDDFFPMARAIAAGTRPPATNRALAGSVPAPILFSSPFMPNPDLSILVVDDAKFSSAMIGRALSQAGYQDIRFASSASEALQQLEQRPVSVLLADWLMPEMDGLELTARVRQLDESINHYTYIVLLDVYKRQPLECSPVSASCLTSRFCSLSKVEILSHLSVMSPP